MTAVRIAAILTLVALGAFYVLRAVATACIGARCDVYIPYSLLLPLLVLLLGAVTGALAFGVARRARQPAWAGALLVLTVVGVAGPLVSLAVFRNQPDAFVATATVLSLLVPVGALGYSFAAPSGRGG